MNILKYIETNKQRFLDELFELLKIPSVSADPAYKKEVFQMAECIKARLMDVGIDNVEICQTKGYPIVYGYKEVDPSFPTVLVYGHYDVQPPDPVDLWDTPPFEPTIKDNKIYARGASDDKGQMYMHVKAFETLINTEGLPCNVKFMIEGEEEIGSDNLEVFLKENRKKLKADVILISDTSIISMDTPSITVGLRGLSYLEVEVTGSNRDLHSGVYGGAVDNPINVLCQMIASLKDENNRISIPKFYDDVVELNDQEREELNLVPFDIQDYKNEIGIDELVGERGFTTIERAGIRPSLDVNGIWGGYIGEGAKTVLPSKAYAKISMRLVPNQSSEVISNLFTDYFKQLAPPSVKVKITHYHGGEPVVTPTNSFAYDATCDAFRKVWGKAPIPTRDGGSIPIVSLFKNTLGLDTILMGFGLDSDAIHSPNEHYCIDNFTKGIETICYFYKYYFYKYYKNRVHH